MITLTRLLDERSCVLFDFDGPICAVFSGIPDRDVAVALGPYVGSPLPPDVSNSRDPFDVLRYASTLGPEAGAAVEHRLTELELEAVKYAKPTGPTEPLIRELTNSGRTVAVVSNNSVPAVDAYLSAHGLRDYVTGIFSRTPANFTQLKPDPHLLNWALSELDVSPASATFIGDSVSDIDAAHAARVAAIAYANRPQKIERFRALKPAALITDMAELIGALSADR
ncbi:HAD family hydrolase [Nocardia sp. NPDC002869]|uniref:HAD family hydrolase n=1 Tax=Nocardia sp. NPDC002869 TaxID=3161032 RepID=UPI00398CCD09